MRQVNVRLDNSVAEQLESTAREYGYTLAGYISVIISGHCANMLGKELEAKQVLLELISTSVPDPTFERPKEIPWEISLPREVLN